MRLKTDGSLDTGYSPSLPGVFNVANINALLVQPDGSVIIGGEFLFGGLLVGSPGSGVLRLDPNGVLDDSFAGTNGVGEAVALALQTDGKLLVACDQNGFVATGPGDVQRVYDISSIPTATIATNTGKIYKNGNRGPATVTITRNPAPNVKTVVKYTVAGIAIKGFDYQPLAGKLSAYPDISGCSHGTPLPRDRPEQRRQRSAVATTLRLVIRIGTQDQARACDRDVRGRADRASHRRRQRSAAQGRPGSGRRLHARCGARRQGQDRRQQIASALGSPGWTK